MLFGKGRDGSGDDTPWAKRPDADLADEAQLAFAAKVRSSR